MRHSLNKTDKEKMIALISSFLIKRGEELIAGYIFGSFLTGEDFSDIDIAILMKTEPSQSLDFELKLEGEIERVIRFPVDVRILNGAPISFGQKVFRTGRVILDREPNLRADFEGRVLKEYFDFSAFRRRYLQEVFSAPV